MKDDNYIVIQGHMINKLGLKGNDLIIYALIAGFTQDDECEFSGSLQYIADWCGSSKNSVIRNLKNLVDKGLITKSEETVNGIKVCKYRCSQNVNSHSQNVNEGGNKMLTGCSQNVNGGVHKMLTNNIDNNIEDNIDNIFASSLESSQPVITLPTNKNNEEYPVVQAFIDEMQNLYEGVDVLKELKAMRAWLITNQKNRKTYSGMVRFINSWLSREQNRAPKHEETWEEKMAKAMKQLEEEEEK